MKTKLTFVFLSIFFLFSSCSKNLEFSKEFMNKTSGRYLYTQDEIIEVYYENNKLYLKWRGAEKIEPVITDANTFFVVDMYKKFRFIEHPETKDWYMASVSKEDENLVTYDYLKVTDSFKTPSMHLKERNFEKALEGYLAIRKEDSITDFVNEWEFNRLGYDFLRDEDYNNAIGVFKMNVALFPESDNVYDSLAEAYLKSGDSMQAFTNYSKALELNTGNKRAKRYIEAYNKSHN